MGRTKQYTKDEVVLRRRYRDFRNQRYLKDEQFDLTAEEYTEIMWDVYINPTNEPKRLGRIDETKPWTKDNVEVRNRQMKHNLPSSVKDPITKVKYYSRIKSAAKFNNEEFTLTLLEFIALWEEHWDDRGLGTKKYRMTRKDSTLGWTKDNVIVSTGPRTYSKSNRLPRKPRISNPNRLTFRDFVKQSKETS